jgi:branched-chain amino acid transport system substrate-binding protein
MTISRRELSRSLPLFAIAASGIASRAAAAEKKYGPGASDADIKIGQTMPYSGPVSAYGVQGRCQTAYFQMLNEQGGINGRKLQLISLDDSYSPPKTVEQTRKLVEQEEVLFLFNCLGTPTSAAVQKYLNSKQVPQLFVSSGASRWGDPQHFPWTMGWAPTYRAEATVYGKYIVKNIPDAKIAVVYQNDDFGKDFLNGFRDGLGEAGRKLIVKEVTYETSDATMDSQVVTLQSSGADVLFNVGTSKFAAQIIRKLNDMNWHPTHFLNSTANSIAATLVPAGLDKSVGLISSVYIKDINDPAYAGASDVKFYLDFMKKYVPDGDVNDGGYAYALAVASTLAQVLKQCGDDLSRENIMRQAANLRDLDVPMLVPGIRINTSPTRYFPINQEQMAKFDGKSWVRFGEVLNAS